MVLSDEIREFFKEDYPASFPPGFMPLMAKVDSLEAQHSVLKARLDGTMNAVEMMKVGRKEEQAIVQQFIESWNTLHGTPSKKQGTK